MVLDTKSKKFSNSLGVKIIAMIISLLMVAGSGTLLFSSVNSAAYYNNFALLVEDKPKGDYTNSSNFVNTFGTHLQEISTYYTCDAKLEAFLKSKKDKVADSAKKLYSEAVKTLREEDEDTFDFRYNETIVYNNQSHEFSFYTQDTNYGNFSDELYNDYDNFVSTESNSDGYHEAKDTIRNFKNLKYCVCDKTGKVIASNLPLKTAKQTILSQSKYLSSLGGKVYSKGYTYFSAINPNPCSSELYAYFTIDETFPDNDVYSHMNNYSKSIESTTIKAEFLSAIALGIVAFALAIFVLANSGKKRSGEIKLCFIDYVPLDITLILSIIISVFSAIGISSCIDNCMRQWISGATQTDLFKTCFAVLIAVCWAVLVNFLCSLIRIIRAKRKPFWKNILLFVIVSVIFKGIKNVFQKIVNALSYKPTNYKKNVVTVGILYALANVILLLCIYFAVYNLRFGIALFFFIFFCINMFITYKAVRYIISLDELITCFKERKTIEADIEKLPQSLKVLSESLKYTNDELSLAVEKAVKDERLKAELITNVSHDLKTPLTSIITYVDLLSKCDIGDENAKKYIAVLDEKGTKLKQLIDDLIEASKVSSGNITLNMVKLNLSELVTQAVGESYADFEKEGLELILQEEENTVTVFADGSKAFRVIQNLLSNAKKYSAKGSRVYVRVYENEQNGFFEIKNVSAEALNISPDELTERFVRGDKSRSKSGNGLGLSIAKELCTAQNGKLTLTIDGDLFKAEVEFKTVSIR